MVNYIKCAKTFDRPNKLERPLKVCTGYREKSHKCSNCDRCYTKPCNPKYHMEKCTGLEEKKKKERKTEKREKIEKGKQY